MKRKKLILILTSVFIILCSFKNYDKVIRILRGHEWSITDVDINEKGNLILSGSWDKTMRLWDLSADSSIYTFSNHKEMIWDVAFSHNDKFVASCSWDGSINIWNLDSKKLYQEFKTTSNIEKIQYEPFYQKRAIPNMCNSIDFSPDNNFLASGSEDGIIRIWNIKHGKLAEKINIHDSSAVDKVIFTKSGNKLITTSSIVKIYDLKTKQVIQTMDGHKGFGICAMDITNNEKYLLTGDISTHNPLIILWDMKTGDSIKVFRGHKTIIRDVCFSNNEKLFASVGEDNLIKIWDLKKGKVIKTMSDNDGKELNTICFTKDDKQIIYGSQDKSIKFREIAELK